MLKNARKIKLVKLLEILRQNSDEDNYLDSAEVLSLLRAEGIDCDRRTLYADIKTLNAFGYEILAEKQKGRANKYCVADRSFDVPELRILMDAVQASGFITPNKTRKLVDKIADLGGSRRAELLRSNTVKFNTTKSENENIFYTINEIGLAIEKERKVSFLYFDYNLNHEKVYRKGGKRYFVNPLATVYDDDNYYLVCYYARYEGVVHYRIDRMDYASMEENQPIDAYKGVKFDLQKHKKTLFGMFQGKEQEVEFIADASILDTVFDVFGVCAGVCADSDNKVKFKASVQISPSFFGWCLSFGEKLKINSPQCVVNEFERYLSQIAGIYGYEIKPM